MLRPLLLIVALAAAATSSPLVPKRVPGHFRPSYASPDEASVRVDPEFYRLPNMTIPEEYDIELVIDPNQRTFSGKVRILIQAMRDTRAVFLHSYRLNYTLAQLRDLNGEVIPTTNNILLDDRHFLSLTLNGSSTLVEGVRYELHFEYTASFTDYLAGVYRSSYYNSEGYLRYLATTQFQATNARDAFPCFDEPALKAVFNIHIYHPNDFYALSNMDVIQPQRPPMTGYNITSFRSTPRMSTYLLAFIVCDFEYKSNTRDGNVVYPREYRVYARPSANDMLDFALDFGQRSMVYLQGYADVTYRLFKVDNVAVPDFAAGAMENWGLVTYAEPYLLYKRGVSTTQDQLNVATTISHETAHFWFGDEVSPAWWDCLWLNEGFATFFESYATDKVMNSMWRLMEQFTVDEIQSVMYVDSLPSTNAMTNEVGSPLEIDLNFNAIAYLKAGAVIRMMQHLLGENLFKLSLSSYLKSLPMGVTQPEILFYEMQKAIADSNVIPSNTNISAIFGSWANQAGYPMLTMTRVNGSSTVVVTQKRFHFNASISTDEKWWVPITFTKSSNLSFDTSKPSLMPPNFPEAYFSVESNEWYLVNLQQSGYYRVMYDAKNWLDLINALNMENHTLIHPLNKAHLIDDSLMFAWTDRLSYNVTFGILNYLQREIDYVPWYSAIRGIIFLGVRMPASEVYETYKQFIRNLSAKVYDSVGGFQVQETDGHLARRNRAQILEVTCNHESAPCWSEAKELFDKKVDNTTVLDPDIEYVVNCNAVRNSTRDRWVYLLEEYEEATSDDEAYDLLAAMACSNDEEVIKSFLDMVLIAGGPILAIDKALVLRFTIINGGPRGIDNVLVFMTNNYLRIRQNIFAQQLSSVFSTLAQFIVTSQQIEAFEVFATRYENNFTPAERTYITTVRRGIAANQEWIESYMETIDAWLIENV